MAMRVATSLVLAIRSLARRPGLSLLAVLTLGLGIGANTAIFSVVDAVLLESLPFRDPDRLVMVWTTTPGAAAAEGFTSYPDFRDWRDEATPFEGLAAYWMFPNGDVNLTGGAEPQRVSVARITPGFFEVLGVTPLHGRTFQDEETIQGNHRRTILSYRLWRTQFGADPTLVGRSVTVNGFPYTVVGVMPADFQARSVRVLGTDVDLWRPLVPEDNQTGGRGARKLRVIGRLSPGVNVPAAEAGLATVAARLASIHPESNRDIGVRLVPLRQQVVRDVERGLVLLLGAVAVVLLSACVNVANLLLIKVASTRRERAVQHALGASRGRLIGAVMLESVLLGGAGAALGLLIAFLGVRAFIAIGPPDMPLLTDARIDGNVLAFTLAATLLTVIGVGILPAWRSTRMAPAAALRIGGNRSSTGDERRAMRLLTGAQIALAMVLLVGAGLLLRSFRSLLEVESGIEADRVLTFQLELPMATTYPTQEGRDAFFRTLLERVEGLPGVRAATMAAAPPFESEPSMLTFSRRGVEDDRAHQANMRLVDAGYFSLLRIPIVEGRAFAATDGRDADHVVIVSRALAQAVWGSRSPVGERIAQPFGGEAEVVGVAGDVRTGGLAQEPGQIVYVPASQWAFNFMTVIVKTEPAPRSVVPAVRGLVRGLDAELPLHHVTTADELLAVSVAPQRFQMMLIGAFGALVLALAVIGTYGVASYGIGQRTSELGIRMALGATGTDVRRLVLREGATLALIGIAVGGLGAVAFGRIMAASLFRTSPIDPGTFLAVPALLAGAVLLATFLPARRASRVEPMQALRTD